MLVREKSLTIYLSGGLGNQLFQIASGVKFAKEILIVNISMVRSEFELEQFLGALATQRGIRISIDKDRPGWFFTKSHNLILRRSQVSNIKLNRVILYLVTTFLARAGLFFSGYTPNQVYFDSPSNQKTGHRTANRNLRVLIGYFQSELIGCEIRDVLKEFINNLYLSEANPYEPQAKKFLVLHARRGDYLDEGKIGALSDHYFQLAVERISRTEPPFQILFFTNGVSNIPSLVSKYTNVPVIIERPNSNSSLRLLYEMKNGDLYALSNSTLSWWAAYLSGSPAERIFAPMPWYQNLDEPINLIPKAWMRIPAEWIGSGLDEK